MEKPPLDYADITDKLVAVAVEEVGRYEIPPNSFGSRCLVDALQLAWNKAIRAEFDLAIQAASPAVQKKYVVAKEIIARTHQDSAVNAVVLLPGMKPTVINICGVECVSFDYTMAGATPLAAVVMEQISDIMDCIEAIDQEKANKE